MESVLVVEADSFEDRVLDELEGGEAASVDERVAGRRVVENGVCTSVDVERAMREVRQRAERVARND